MNNSLSIKGIYYKLENEYVVEPNTTKCVINIIKNTLKINKLQPGHYKRCSLCGTVKPISEFEYLKNTDKNIIICEGCYNNTQAVHNDIMYNSERKQFRPDILQALEDECERINNFKMPANL